MSFNILEVKISFVNVVFKIFLLISQETEEKLETKTRESKDLIMANDNLNEKIATLNQVLVYNIVYVEALIYCIPIRGGR